MAQRRRHCDATREGEGWRERDLQEHDHDGADDRGAGWIMGDEHYRARCGGNRHRSKSRHLRIHLQGAPVVVRAVNRRVRVLMKTRFATVLCVCTALVPVGVAAQTTPAPAAKKTAKAYVPPKTVWGDPNLAG